MNPSSWLGGNNGMKHNKIEKMKENKGEYHLAYANTQPNAKECL